MHWSRPVAVLATLACLSLAGCTAPVSEPDDGDDMTGGVGDGMGSGHGNDGGTSMPGPGFAPQEGHDENVSSELPGLALDGRFGPCEGGFCLNATATNEGSATYHISSICVPAWHERMEQAGEPVQHREPVAYCAAFGTRPLGPGDQVPFQAIWNGTLWHDEAQAYVPAPEGAYDWIAAFRVHEDADGGGSSELTLRFHVIIGAT